MPCFVLFTSIIFDLFIMAKNDVLRGPLLGSVLLLH
jgi:hypothetical protein